MPGGKAGDIISDPMEVEDWSTGEVLGKFEGEEDWTPAVLVEVEGKIPALSGDLKITYRFVMNIDSAHRLSSDLHQIIERHGECE